MEGHAATIVSSYHPHEISERAGIDKAANEKAAKLKADRLARVVDMRAGALNKRRNDEHEEELA